MTITSTSVNLLVREVIAVLEVAVVLAAAPEAGQGEDDGGDPVVIPDPRDIGQEVANPGTVFPAKLRSKVFRLCTLHLMKSVWL